MIAKLGNSKPKDPRNSKDPKQNQHKEKYTEKYTITLLKTSDEEKMLKAPREKRYISYTEGKIRMMKSTHRKLHSPKWHDILKATNDYNGSK